jgi:nitroreductase
VEVGSVRVSRRDGRRFVHVRLEVDDIQQLSRLAPFSWSTYEFRRRGELLEYKQAVGAAAAKAVQNMGWNGSEIVAFRMHIPSVIAFHNSPSRRVQRGNILEWEQPLAERLKGVPVDVEVNMEPDSILYTTLLLFGATILLAAATFGLVIWRVARHGRDEVAPVNRHA